MADLVVGTVAKVYGGQRTETANAAFTAGEPMYRNPADGYWYPAKNDTAAHAHSPGIALNSGAAQQPVTIQTSGVISLGVAGVVGSTYHVSSNAGGLAPEADYATGHYATPMCVAIGTFGTTANCFLVNPTPTDVAHV